MGSFADTVRAAFRRQASPTDIGNFFSLPLYTVATLPAGAEGWVAMVTDATLTAITGLGVAPTGGGTNVVPVYRDNVGWKII